MGDLEWLDLSDVEADTGSGGGGWSVLPDGWYRMMVTESEVKANAAGTGQFVRVKLSHLDESHQNRFELDFLNVQHAKPKVQEIGRSQFKALAIAANHPTPDQVHDSRDLWNQPLMVRLYSEHDPGKYADSDGMVQRIGGYKSCDVYDAEEGGPPPSTPAPNPAGASAAPPDDIPF